MFGQDWPEPTALPECGRSQTQGNLAPVATVLGPVPEMVDAGGSQPIAVVALHGQSALCFGKS